MFIILVKSLKIRDAQLNFVDYNLILNKIYTMRKQYDSSDFPFFIHASFVYAATFGSSKIIIMKITNMDKISLLGPIWPDSNSPGSSLGPHPAFPPTNHQYYRSSSELECDHLHEKTDLLGFHRQTHTKLSPKIPG